MQSFPRIFWITALVLALFSGSLLAHAILTSAAPGVNATVHGSEAPIVLKFNSRIDAARSGISIVGPDKSLRKLTLDSQSSPDTISARASGLAAGVYRVKWQVLASDGHITRGEFAFKVD